MPENEEAIEAIGGLEIVLQAGQLAEDACHTASGESTFLKWAVMGLSSVQTVLSVMQTFGVPIPEIVNPILEVLKSILEGFNDGKASFETIQILEAHHDSLSASWAWDCRFGQRCESRGCIECAIASNPSSFGYVSAAF